jgi:hypothetical protein
MKRHETFEKLKERANSSLTNNFISNETAIISFIDILKGSVVPQRQLTDKTIVANPK